jgi:hypothetical protein
VRENTLVEDVETLLAERTAEILESLLFESENVFELLTDFDSALEVGGGSDISLAVRGCNGGTGLSLFSIVLINWVPTTLVVQQPINSNQENITWCVEDECRNIVQVGKTRMLRLGGEPPGQPHWIKGAPEKVKEVQGRRELYSGQCIFRGNCTLSFDALSALAMSSLMSGSPA